MIYEFSGSTNSVAYAVMLDDMKPVDWTCAWTFSNPMVSAFSLESASIDGFSGVTVDSVFDAFLSKPFSKA